jgi:hypothetical protein
MEIESTTFGTITIDGKTYEHDVVIRLSGDVVKRKKKLSKKYYGTSHMLSKDERRIGLLRPNGESGRLSLRLFLNPINRLTLQSRRLDRFRPSYYDRIAAGLGSDGLPVAWTHRVTSGTVRQYFDAQLGSDVASQHLAKLAEASQ